MHFWKNLADNFQITFYFAVM